MAHAAWPLARHPRNPSPAPARPPPPSPAAAGAGLRDAPPRAAKLNIEDLFPSSLGILHVNLLLEFLLVQTLFRTHLQGFLMMTLLVSQKLIVSSIQEKPLTLT
ncbi:hypothetical protein E2562_004839 [Oryza meyeriana var. granulata]|uniref:Uncharacterized protein n=1 Tax=Oryza meyeriana var. granulata TaxID=110450 RepID=A0A6G1DFA3_9ORYZ|nr:hypothetical protein E2562_004839 [Oryza meyeriana var. granulata]